MPTTHNVFGASQQTREAGKRQLIGADDLSGRLVGDVEIEKIGETPVEILRLEDRLTPSGSFAEGVTCLPEWIETFTQTFEGVGRDRPGQQNEALIVELLAYRRHKV